jgi:hypothetical protein
MDEEFALYALETLTAQAPDPVIAESAKGSSIESFGLKDVSVDAVEFPPTSGTSSIYTPCGHTNTTISVFNKSLVVQITKFLFVLSFAQQYALQEWQHRRCGNAILNSLQKYNRQKSYRVRGR